MGLIQDFTPLDLPKKSARQNDLRGFFCWKNDVIVISDMVSCSFRLRGVTRCPIVAHEVSGPVTKLAWLFGGAPWHKPSRVK